MTVLVSRLSGKPNIIPSGDLIGLAKGKTYQKNEWLQNVKVCFEGTWQ